MSCPIHDSSSKSLLAVNTVSGGTVFADETTQVLDEFFRRRETTNAQRQQNPSASVRIARRVHRQLLAYLAVDLIPETTLSKLNVIPMYQRRSLLRISMPSDAALESPPQ